MSENAAVSTAPEPAEKCTFLDAGTPAYRRANLAMFVGGFATFAMLYGTQPILPLLSEAFGINPASASLSVSAGTAALALLLIPASILSDRIGRMRVMKASLALAAMVSLASPFVTDFNQLLVLRALLGAALAGLPAAAMAYLGEEIAPQAQGRAMGLYIAGNALGGMSGRFISALVAQWSSWRIALGVLGVLGAIAAILFWRSLPASRHFSARAARPAGILSDVRILFSDAAMPWLFLTAFLLMGAFIALYNYLGFRLMAPPFGLSQSAIGAIFGLYIIGTWASAWSGQLADRHGRRNILWVMVSVMASGLLATLSPSLTIIITGVAIYTFGFFAAHAVASGWVARRANERRALAAALYLSSYYLGASIIGTLAGLTWTRHAWGGVALVVGVCLATSLLLAGLHLRRIEPPRLP